MTNTDLESVDFDGADLTGAQLAGSQVGLHIPLLAALSCHYGVSRRRRPTSHSRCLAVF